MIATITSRSPRDRRFVQFTAFLYGLDCEPITAHSVEVNDPDPERILNVVRISGGIVRVR